MSGANMTLHCGGFTATEGEIAGIDPPAATKTYCPIPHVELINRVKDLLPRFSLGIEKEKYALANEGQRMFGVISCSPTSAASALHRYLGDMPVQLAIGMRNSYDQSFSATLLAGSRVWLCDNLSMSADVVVKRKHTAKAWDDLDFIVFDMMRQVEALFPQELKLYEEMMGCKLSRVGADHILLEAARKRAIPFTRLPQVDELYTKGDAEIAHAQKPFRELFPENTAWRLFNAFTEVYKSRHPAQLMDESKRLHTLFDSYLRPGPSEN